MKNVSSDESLVNAINNITEKLSHVLLQEFLQLPKELQINIMLIKSAQLLLANILCHVVTAKEELASLADVQGDEIKELTFDCAMTGFATKFNIKKH